MSQNLRPTTPRRAATKRADVGYGYCDCGAPLVGADLTQIAPTDPSVICIRSGWDRQACCEDQGIVRDHFRLDRRDGNPQERVGAARLAYKEALQRKQATTQITTGTILQLPPNPPQREPDYGVVLALQAGKRRPRQLASVDLPWRESLPLLALVFASWDHGEGKKWLHRRWITLGGRGGEKGIKVLGRIPSGPDAQDLAARLLDLAAAHDEIQPPLDDAEARAVLREIERIRPFIVAWRWKQDYNLNDTGSAPKKDLTPATDPR